MVAVFLNSYFRTLVASTATFIFISVCVLLLNSPHSQQQLHFVDPTYGRLHPISSVAKPRYAIATFLSHDTNQDWDLSDVQNDFHFIGARILTYQLLYANETKLSDRTIPFLVLCTSTVSAQKRQQLILDGATIIPVDTPPLPAHLQETERMKYNLDHLAKLRLFALTQYDRIYYIAPMTYLKAPIDPVLSDPALQLPAATITTYRPDELKQDEAPLPANYLFAARSDNMVGNVRDPYWHEHPPALTDTFSPFAMLLAPSIELYSLLLTTLHSPSFKISLDEFYERKFSYPWNRWSNGVGPDTAVLNYVFRREGGMPWTELDPRWSANWGNDKDVEKGVKMLQGEYWWSGPIPVRDRWVEWRGRMEAEFA